MIPEWCDAGSLPLDQMWDDEAYWLPRVLGGETLAGTITYDEACKLVARAELETARRGRLRRAELARRGGLITAPRPRKSRSSGKRCQGRQPGVPGAHPA